MFKYTGAKDLRQDVDILTELEKADVGRESVAASLQTLFLYDETANALEFYQDHLGETLDCNLPLSIYPFWPDRRSKFEIDSGRGSGTPSPAIFLTPDRLIVREPRTFPVYALPRIQPLCHVLYLWQKVPGIRCR